MPLPGPPPELKPLPPPPMATAAAAAAVDDEDEVRQQQKQRWQWQQVRQQWCLARGFCGAVAVSSSHVDADAKWCVICAILSLLVNLKVTVKCTTHLQTSGTN
jgi:hypothetical protein